MNAWSWLGVLGGALFVLDSFRLRRSLASLPVLPPGAPGPEARKEYEVWLAPGASLAEPSLDAALAYAQTQKLDVLDLIPQRWSTFAALAYAQMGDASKLRTQRLAFGYSAGQAMIVKRTVLAAAGMATPSGVEGVERPAADALRAPTDAVGFARAARRLKCYAPLSFGVAVAPGLHRATRSASERNALTRWLFQQLTPSVFAVQGLAFALIALCAWRGWLWGAAALAAYSLQPPLALVGTAVGAADLLPCAVFALPLQIFDWARVIASGRPDAERRAAIEARRAAYAADLVPGVGRFLEPRQSKCYVCGGEHLQVAGHFSDLGQHKPGRFAIERCADCGHLSQNPRLSLEGLGFYYRDFYDGLGEESLEVIFGLNPDAYLARARSMTGEPARWLDVGGGFGHFCWAAREVFPKTRFECLDMGASVEEAARRGWADASHRGQLPELAGKLAGQFDVVSLLHCLEHSRDPRAEIAAAFEVLQPGGRLLIEVPDPECIWRRVLGPFWMPYFQPQHLHLLSVHNLSRLLREKGYVVERSERSKLGDNFTLALLLIINRLDPEESPWLPPKSRARAALGALLRAVATPAFIVTWLVDRLIRVIGALPHSSNAFRILARKPDLQPAASP